MCETEWRGPSEEAPIRLASFPGRPTSGVLPPTRRPVGCRAQASAAAAIGDACSPPSSTTAKPRLAVGPGQPGCRGERARCRGVPRAFNGADPRAQPWRVVAKGKPAPFYRRFRSAPCPGAYALGAKKAWRAPLARRRPPEGIDRVLFSASAQRRCVSKCSRAREEVLPKSKVLACCCRPWAWRAL